MWNIVRALMPRKYEASIYFLRQHEEPPQREEDLQYYLTRLHDIYIKKRSAKDVFTYVKEYIKDPRTDDDGVWAGVLKRYGIPFWCLRWNRIFDTGHTGKETIFACYTDVFYHNGLACQLKIKVFCEHKEKVFSPFKFGTTKPDRKVLTPKSLEGKE